MVRALTEGRLSDGTMAQKGGPEGSSLVGYQSNSELLDEYSRSDSGLRPMH